MSLKVYHYTNDSAWYGMHHGREGWIYPDYLTGEYIDGEKIRGLWIGKRFVPCGYGTNLPFESHDGMWEGLLSPIPEWDEYTYPTLFRHLMSSICRENVLILLELDVLPSDNIFVYERGYIEDVYYYNQDLRDLDKLHNKNINDFKTIKAYDEHCERLDILRDKSYEAKDKAYERMYMSIISIHDYVKGNIPNELKSSYPYKVPTVCSFSPFPLERITARNVYYGYHIWNEFKSLPVLECAKA